MNNEQQKALETMVEWRNALHDRIMSGQDRENGDIGLWFALIGLRNTMNDVTKAFGFGSFAQDLDKVSADC